MNRILKKPNEFMLSELHRSINIIFKSSIHNDIHFMLLMDKKTKVLSLIIIIIQVEPRTYE